MDCRWDPAVDCRWDPAVDCRWDPVVDCRRDPVVGSQLDRVADSRTVPIRGGAFQVRAYVGDGRFGHGQRRGVVDSLAPDCSCPGAPGSPRVNSGDELGAFACRDRDSNSDDGCPSADFKIVTLADEAEAAAVTIEKSAT